MNHLPHILLMIVTVGLWFPVWLLLAGRQMLGAGPWRCSTCGHKARKSLLG